MLNALPSKLTFKNQQKWALAAIASLALLASSRVQADSVTHGSFDNDSILDTELGGASNELFGAGFADTSTGYTGPNMTGYYFVDPGFGGYNGYEITGNNTQYYQSFLANGATSGNATFDGLLNAAVYGSASGNAVDYVLTGLSVGTTYNLLLLDSDTRTYSPGSTFSFYPNTNSTTVNTTTAAATQTFAYSAGSTPGSEQTGTTAIGGFIDDKFTAQATSYDFAITTSNSTVGQLNGIVLAKAVATPEPSTYGLMLGGLAVLGLLFRVRRHSS